MSVIPVAEVRARLNKTTNADDAELQQMLDAAEAEYAERVGPIGTTTTRYYGGPFPRYATGVVLTDQDGNVLDPDIYVGSQYLYWNEPLGIMGHGLYQYVNMTYTVTLPAHHREAILADVAGLFAATQRGNSPGALPGAGYEAGFEDRGTPVVLFPRIRQLALSLSSIG